MIDRRGGGGGGGGGKGGWVGWYGAGGYVFMSIYSPFSHHVLYDINYSSVDVSFLFLVVIIIYLSLTLSKV